MSNLFDSANYPTTEPDTLIAGDRWAWKRTDLGGDYPTASYSLKYSARREGTGAPEIEITCSESGTEYHAEVAAATTDGYTPGTYHWQAYITRTSDSERITIARGTWTVKANSDTDNSDPRSHVKKVLDAIESSLETAAGKRQGSMSVDNVSISWRSFEELTGLRNQYRAEYVREQRKERIGRGEGHDGRVLVRF